MRFFLFLTFILIISSLVLVLTLSKNREIPLTAPPAVVAPSASLTSPPIPTLPTIPLTPTVKILNPTIQTGETLIVQFNEAPNKILFGDSDTEIKPFPYQEGFRAIIPIPLETKTGTSSLRAEFANNTVIEKSITLLAKKQLVIVLPPPPKLGLTDKEIVQNLLVANADLRKIVAEVEDITRFSEPFGLPVKDANKISSPFGEIRKTGKESIIHLGVDFDVPKGEAVYTINDGVIKNAYFDTIYGNSIIVDHGRGIYSLYLHLNSIDVKNGEAVKRGTLLGTVGDSGLASASHLHLSLKINGVSVDPLQFISTFK